MDKVLGRVWPKGLLMSQNASILSPLITLEVGFVPTLCDLNPSAFSNGNIFIPSGISGEPHSIQLPSAQCPGKGTCGVGARARSFGKDRASPTPALC